MKISVKSYLSKPPNLKVEEVFKQEVSTTEYTIAQLLKDLGVSTDEAGLIFVNQQRVGKKFFLKDGDTVVIVPVLEGG